MKSYINKDTFAKGNYLIFLYYCEKIYELNTIDFRTSHNIVVSFNLASLGIRITAFLIDLFITFILFYILKMLALGNESLEILFSVMVFFLFHLSFEVFHLGQSPGKQLLGLRVVTIDGAVPSLKSYIIRWSFRLIDILFTLGTLGGFAIYSSTRGQRIGDLLAGTTVINAKLETLEILNEIEKLNARSKVVSFEKINQYNDEEMLMLKNLLYRYQGKQTPENAILITKMAQKISADLNVDISKQSKVAFLERVLSDYIVATR